MIYALITTLICLAAFITWLRRRPFVGPWLRLARCSSCDRLTTEYAATFDDTCPGCGATCRSFGYPHKSFVGRNRRDTWGGGVTLEVRK